MRGRIKKPMWLGGERYSSPHQARDPNHHCSGRCQATGELASARIWNQKPGGSLRDLLKPSQAFSASEAASDTHPDGCPLPGSQGLFKRRCANCLICLERDLRMGIWLFPRESDDSAAPTEGTASSKNIPSTEDTAPPEKAALAEDSASSKDAASTEDTRPPKETEINETSWCSRFLDVLEQIKLGVSSLELAAANWRAPGLPGGKDLVVAQNDLDKKVENALQMLHGFDFGGEVLVVGGGGSTIPTDAAGFGAVGIFNGLWSG